MVVPAFASQDNRHVEMLGPRGSSMIHANEEGESCCAVGWAGEANAINAVSNESSTADREHVVQTEVNGHKRPKSPLPVRSACVYHCARDRHVNQTLGTLIGSEIIAPPRPTPFHAGERICRPGRSERQVRWVLLQPGRVSVP